MHRHVKDFGSLWSTYQIHHLPLPEWCVRLGIVYPSQKPSKIPSRNFKRCLPLPFALSNYPVKSVFSHAVSCHTMSRSWLSSCTCLLQYHRIFLPLRPLIILWQHHIPVTSVFILQCLCICIAQTVPGFRILSSRWFWFILEIFNCSWFTQGHEPLP